ncbi:Eco57I restriction-modification methylase domain-containing protein [Terrabacter sp. GCM10028922]|uniref:Eco57I restriction-modification methylase domain-containing protein n=1 Tax=Terrabacter sp. GCM10028922 TaxID=3273428 RepID=UPI003623B4CD
MIGQRMRLVNEGRFRDLFIEELGWAKANHPDLKISTDDGEYTLTQVAGYKGVRVWFCPSVPSPRDQRLIDHEVNRISDERLIVFADSVHQQWRWPQSSNPLGSGQARLTTHAHVVGTENPALDQRLAMVEIGLNEEPNVVEILRRMRSAFDADKITKGFYDKFLAKHRALVEAIHGLDTSGEREWYSALLMNRLMFIYFLQRKGFLDGDRDYLRSRLDALRSKSGDDNFYEFYRDFLLPLFHEGLGAPGLEVADPVIKGLLGDIPYLNGGIFAVHELEEAHEDITIPDRVFESIFDLFDAYQWHLDDRPSANPNEINPDVLGYIFEQFINQKEQGAYYTKEDVTHFMTSSTLIPVFLERLEKATGINPWAYVAAEPARYIWASLQHGLDLDFAAEVEDQRDGFPRPAWNSKAPESLALPGETWWEVEHRRTTYAAVVEAAKSGNITDVDTAVTYNLDLESLATDVIDGMDSPSDVVAAWAILSGLKIIDPTCGSGAFLFAALKILQALYSAVLDAARSQAKTSSEPGLRSLLADVDAHPNALYFTLKHSTLSNLYGVDLMKEATEIARLRLFLKLVSAIDDRNDLEPLPDLDFNIKAGNVLVGARVAGEIEDTNDLLSSQTIDAVMAQANEITEAYREFRKTQESGGPDMVKGARDSLAAKLAAVRDTVNEHYHSANGLSGSVDGWTRSHSPFHWFIEYPEVFSEGGFDVVIGNPPYINKRKVQGYAFRGFATDDTPDIYAPCTERSSQITRPDGRMTLIIPISAQFGGEFTALRQHLEKRFSRLWVSTFSRNPAALFSAGLGVRSTIVVGSGSGAVSNSLHTTKTHRWIEEYRPALFETLTYVQHTAVSGHGGWVRLVDEGIAKLFGGLSPKGGLAQMVASRGGMGSVGFKTTALYWLSVFSEDPPSYELNFQPTPQTKIGRLRFANAHAAKIALAILASKVAFVWWYCTGDDFDVTADGLKSSPINVSALSQQTKQRLAEIADDMVADFPNHIAFTKYAGKWMGNYVHSEMRDITDEVDKLLADDLGYTELLPALEHAYYCVYKPTGDRPGTLRYDPAVKARTV